MSIELNVLINVSIILVKALMLEKLKIQIIKIMPHALSLIKYVHVRMR
jgi:hypothetical protein